MCIRDRFKSEDMLLISIRLGLQTISPDFHRPCSMVWVICSEIRTRLWLGISFESLTPILDNSSISPDGIANAPTTNGPMTGPLPASSTPMIQWPSTNRRQLHGSSSSRNSRPKESNFSSKSSKSNTMLSGWIISLSCNLSAISIASNIASSA